MSKRWNHNWLKFRLEKIEMSFASQSIPSHTGLYIFLIVCLYQSRRHLLVANSMASLATSNNHHLPFVQRTASGCMPLYACPLPSPVLSTVKALLPLGLASSSQLCDSHLGGVDDLWNNSKTLATWLYLHVHTTEQYCNNDCTCALQNHKISDYPVVFITVKAGLGDLSFL